MEISVRLYGSLRDKLPAEKRGKAMIELMPSATVDDLLTVLHLGQGVSVSINEGIVKDRNRPLIDGETVIIFTQSAGG